MNVYANLHRCITDQLSPSTPILCQRMTPTTTKPYETARQPKSFFIVLLPVHHLFSIAVFFNILTDTVFIEALKLAFKKITTSTSRNFVFLLALFLSELADWM